MSTEPAPSAPRRRLKNAPAGRHPERIGRFAVVEYFAAGGMADLYLVRPDGQKDYVVVKRIAEHYSGIQRIVDLFIDEGRIAAQLSHPNIVRMLETGQESGQYFLAMEYIRGRDLVAIVRQAAEVRRPMPRSLAVALCAQVARGLVHAHEKLDPQGRPLKIVHCDISPGNVVVSWGGTAKIVDFGIARAEIQLREANGSVAGKYNYMAPEQIRGEAVDGRADLFSLGVILYELTVGRRLFRGRPEEVMHKVLEAPIVPPHEVEPDYDPALEAVVMKALARDPADRWPTARALYEALIGVLSATGGRVEKRGMAAYLREIFSLAKVQDADDLTAPDTSLSDSAGDLAAVHLVDDDDPVTLPPPPHATPSGVHEQDTAPVPRLTAADLDTAPIPLVAEITAPSEITAPAPTAAATASRAADAQAQARARSLALILLGFSVVMVVYFLLFR